MPAICSDVQSDPKWRELSALVLEDGLRSCWFTPVFGARRRLIAALDLEARVRKRTQELQESNRELEAFSYSVSHDLRGPLRAIAGFTGLLRDRHYETIDTDGRRYIDRVRPVLGRMPECRERRDAQDRPRKECRT